MLFKVMYKITEIYYFTLYKIWLSVTRKGAIKKLVPSRSDLRELVYNLMPLIIIKHPIDLSSNEKILLLMSREENLSYNLKCPNTTNKMRRIKDGEIPHTPIAYSMRHYNFDRKYDMPTNYDKELEELAKYKLNLEF